MFATNDTTIDKRLCLVDFNTITPDALNKHIKEALAQADDYLNNLPDASTAKDALAMIDTLNEKIYAFSRSFGILSHLNSVISREDIRQCHHEILPLLSAFYTKLGQSFKLYNLYNTLNQTPSDDIAQNRAVKLALEGFQLSGVNLDDDKKAKFADIASRLSVLSAKFSDNALDAAQAFALPLTQEQLSGITPNGLALLKSAGEIYKSKHPNTLTATDYVATLDIPMYLAVMQYADDRQLRKTLYDAYNTKASDQSSFGYNQFDNSAIMCQILQLRQQKAELLGFDDYTELSLATKMADNKAQIDDFLYHLAKHATPFAKSDLADIQILAKTLGIDDVQPYDIPYLSEKIRQEKYNLNSDELRPYFPLPVVLEGLFDIIHTLFGVRFQPLTVPVWHDDVQFFEVFDGNELIGGIYLDLFARNGKRGGAWLSGFQDKYKNATKKDARLPVGFIVANFAPPTENTPSLLTFDEVTTLFHEFGHGLHHLLTKITISDVAGINGVEWDAVELPSQFMENFAISEQGITKISRHVQTGKPLPKNLLQALILAKNFQSGLQTLRQIEFGLFDLAIHHAKIENYTDILTIQDDIRQKVAVIQVPANNRFANTFSHIFAGGYAAGYYSYKWAELLSADAFSRFEQEGVFNPSVGNHFKQEILERGGSRCAKENFEAFMGRSANITALLKQSGFVFDTHKE